LGHVGSNPVHACQRNDSSVRCKGTGAVVVLARALLRASVQSLNWRVLRAVLRHSDRCLKEQAGGL
jgi:hypothetical protein